MVLAIVKQPSFIYMQTEIKTKIEEPLLFTDSLGRKLTPQSVVNEIIGFMGQAKERQYLVCLGTDSAPLSNKKADFVTAIIVHRVGNGARYFWRRARVEDKFHTLRDRMYKEVLLSLETARHFLEMTRLFKIPNFNFEIHVDVGENGKTNTMIKELTAMIRGSNFAVKIKPDSYAASKVADRHGRKGD